MIKVAKNYGGVTILGLLILYSLYKLSYGIGIDEYSLILVSNNILNGTRPFVDHTEVIQLAGISYLPVIGIVKEFLGTTEGLMMSLRYVYFVIYVGVTLYLTTTLLRCGYKKTSFVVAAFYLTYTMGWMNFSYKAGLDTGIALIICSCLRYYHSKNAWNVVISGIGISISVISYPAAILMAIAVFLYYLLNDKLKDRHAKVNIKAALVMLSVCLVCASAFFVYVLSQISFREFLEYFPKILVSDNNPVPIYIKIAKAMVYYIGFGILAVVPFVARKVVAYVLKKQIDDHFFGIILGVYWGLFLLAICVARVSSVSVSRLTYAFVILLWWSIYYYRKSDLACKKEIFLFFILPSLICQFGQVISTNQGIASYATGSKFAIMGLILLALHNKDKFLVAIVMIATLFFHVVWVLENMGGWGSVFEKRITVETGISKGIKLKPETYDYYMAVTELSDYINNNDKVLMLESYSNILYLDSDSVVGAMRGWEIDFNNDSLIDFYDDCPWMIPDKIVARKGSLGKNYECPDTRVGDFVRNGYEIGTETSTYVIFERKRQ